MNKLLLLLCGIWMGAPAGGAARVLSPDEMSATKGGQDTNVCPGVCVYQDTCFAQPGGPYACTPLPNPPPPVSGTHCHGAFADYVTSLPQDICTVDWDDLSAKCNLMTEEEACTEYDIYECTNLYSYEVYGEPPVKELVGTDCWTFIDDSTLVDTVIEGDATVDAGGSTECQSADKSE